MKSFHDKFIAALKSAQAYAKFWVAVAGGVLIVITSNVPIDEEITRWITTGLAIITAFSVYAFPNTVPDIDQP